MALLCDSFLRKLSMGLYWNNLLAFPIHPALQWSEMSHNNDCFRDSTFSSFSWWASVRIKPTWEQRTNHKLSNAPCDLYLLQSALQLSLFLPWTVPKNVKFFVHIFLIYIRWFLPLLISAQSLQHHSFLPFQIAPKRLSSFLTFHIVTPSLSSLIPTCRLWHSNEFLISEAHHFAAFQLALCRVQKLLATLLLQLNTDKEETTNTWGAPVLRLHRTEVPHKVCLSPNRFSQIHCFYQLSSIWKIRAGTQTHLLLCVYTHVGI